MAGVEEELPLQEIESLCMRCGENGTTRLLLTCIPHFREVVLMAFDCSHCNERNNEVQFAGQLQSQGCCYTLTVPEGDIQVLSRQVVKSDSATIKIPELEFEVPPEAQRGTLSTVEGVLLRAADELGALQEERRKIDAIQAEALDHFLVKLRSCIAGESSFTFVISDPAGNSFIENPHAPGTDPLLSLKFYDRSSAEQASLGFLSEPIMTEDNANSSEISERNPENTYEDIPANRQNVWHGTIGAQLAHRAIAHSNNEDVATSLLRYSAPEEVMTFPSTCSACAASCETRMYATQIPYFKEVIVMATTCDSCGYRNSELKPGGSIPSKGKKITVAVQSQRDLSRDVIKSDTSSVYIPELELELVSGTLGGLVTTVEGLLQQISERLKGMNQFCLGDSAIMEEKQRWHAFEEKTRKLLNVETPWTLILDDPLANSFIAPLTEDILEDAQLQTKEYERTWQQDEDIGLHDMDTSSADGAYHNGATQ